MPILGKETDIFPPDLLDRSDWDQGRWWVLHTLPRREKDLARRLEKARVSFFSPTIAREQRSPSGRIRTSYALLFPSYVFVFGSEQDRAAALVTNCVANCLHVPDQSRLITDLLQIQKVISAGVDLTPEGQLETGDVVRVKSGPMLGVIGTVVERRGNKRLLVQINFLQKGASVELHDIDLEPYSP